MSFLDISQIVSDSNGLNASGSALSGYQNTASTYSQQAAMDQSIFAGYFRQAQDARNNMNDKVSAENAKQTEKAQRIKELQQKNEEIKQELAKLTNSPEDQEKAKGLNAKLAANNAEINSANSAIKSSGNKVKGFVDSLVSKIKTDNEATKQKQSEEQAKQAELQKTQATITIVQGVAGLVQAAGQTADKAATAVIAAPVPDPVLKPIAIGVKATCDGFIIPTSAAVGIGAGAASAAVAASAGDAQAAISSATSTINSINGLIPEKQAPEKKK